MRKKVGTACMALGTLLILSVLCLVIYNRQEAAQAEESVQLTVAAIEEFRAATEAESETSALTSTETEIDISEPDSSVAGGTEEPGSLPAAEESGTSDVTTVWIDGYSYIGTLTIPALGLELPVMDSWSYDYLKLSPCRYSGSTGTDDLIIAGHNYTSHFGTLKNLQPGDSIYFTDMDGITLQYTVAAVEILEPAELEVLTGSDYPLTLFTCTWSGQARLAVRCELVVED